MTDGLTPSTIEGLSVTSLYERDYLQISWTGISSADTYTIYRSATPYSTPEALSTLYPQGISIIHPPGITTTYPVGITYFDYTPLVLDNDFYYYATQTQGLTESIKQTLGVTNEPYDVFEATPSAPPLYDMDAFSDYFVNDIMEEKFEEIRNRTLALLQNDGEDVYLMKRRWSGKRCPACWDEMAQQAQARCPVCFGTGWIGGYYPKISIKVRIVPEGRVVVVYEEGLRKEYEPRSWTIWTPRLRDRDIIIRKNNQRFEILNVTDFPRWRGLRTRQDFDTKLLVPEDIVHAVPVT